MDISFSREDAEIARRAREFTREVLLPAEIEIELEGRISPDRERVIRDDVRSCRLNAVNHSCEHGGQGMTIVQQLIVNEEIGKATNGLWYYVWVPPLCLRHGSPEQIDRYLRPACSGEIFTAYSITEPGAGSDVAGITTRADADGDDFVIVGEKCFASESEKADVILLHAHVSGDARRPTIFLVDPKSPGFVLRRSPEVMVNTMISHPEVGYEGLRVHRSSILGEIGAGFDLTKEWFVESRLYIAARCIGAAIRATELAHEHASRRVAFGKPVREFQAIEFSLADMAASILAGKSMVYRIAAQLDAGADKATAHGLASAAKLYCSELAGRVIDSALQIFGGKGFQRENPVNRLYRDVRAERIWEGTSEIQRIILGKQLSKRGTATFTSWPGEQLALQSP